MQSIARIHGSLETGNAAVATVQTLRLPAATTIIVDTVDGIPTHFFGSMGTPHTFVDPITSEEITVISEATAVDFSGHVDTTNLIIDAIAPGYTDAGSAVGDIVVIRPTTQWADNVADVLAADHNDAGGHQVTVNYDPAHSTLETQKWAGVASAVNEITVTNAATGNNPSVSATGGDTNVGVNAITKGTGNFQLNGTDLTRYIEIHPFLPTTTVGTWTPTASGNAASGGWNQSSGSQNDEITFPVFLPAGTWTFSALVDTGTNLGICTVYLDGVSVGTFDSYAAVAVHNAVKTITGIAVATAGLKTIKLKMATKNASSSAYYLLLQMFTLYKTA